MSEASKQYVEYDDLLQEMNSGRETVVSYCEEGMIIFHMKEVSGSR